MRLLNGSMVYERFHWAHRKTTSGPFARDCRPSFYDGARQRLPAAAQKCGSSMADDCCMFTIFAIDRDGHEHHYAAGDCTTLEEVLDGLNELAYEGSLESEPDDPFFVRYGITFTDEGAAELAQQFRRFTPPWIVREVGA